MQASLHVAVIQMNARLDVAANLATAERLVREAAEAGAQWVLLPELFNCYGPLEEVVQQAEPIPGPTSQRLAGLARELQIYLCAGSICEQSATPGKGYNTSLLLAPSGDTVGCYRKLHLFDVEIPGQFRVTESQAMLPGDKVVLTALPLGRVGQAICYDLRFPELFRALVDQRLEILAIPSAFTASTGRDHWEVLLRARAIESQCYVLAPNQFGAHGAGLASYGGSLIIDPWGKVLARAALDKAEILHAELHDDVLMQVRRRLPALAHRRL
jgi:predicted amidohydrolase